MQSCAWSRERDRENRDVSSRKFRSIQPRQGQMKQVIVASGRPLVLEARDSSPLMYFDYAANGTPELRPRSKNPKAAMNRTHLNSTSVVISSRDERLARSRFTRDSRPGWDSNYGQRP